MPRECEFFVQSTGTLPANRAGLEQKTDKERFRWVQCQLDLLPKLRTLGAVRKTLDSLPLTLNKAYEDLLDRIDGEEDRPLTKQILQILAFTFRPLSSNEVCTMLQIIHGRHHLKRSKCLTHPMDILDICGSLLKYSDKTGTVILAHHSMKTYLTSTSRNKASSARICPWTNTKKLEVTSELDSGTNKRLRWTGDIAVGIRFLPIRGIAVLIRASKEWKTSGTPDISKLSARHCSWPVIRILYKRKARSN